MPLASHRRARASGAACPRHRRARKVGPRTKPRWKHTTLRVLSTGLGAILPAPPAPPPSAGSSPVPRPPNPAPTSEVVRGGLQQQDVDVEVFGYGGLGHVAVGPRETLDAVAPPGLHVAHASPAAKLVLFGHTGDTDTGGRGALKTLWRRFWRAGDHPRRTDSDEADDGNGLPATTPSRLSLDGGPGIPVADGRGVPPHMLASPSSPAAHP